ncbi:MAG: type II toxin-antitoxin system PemK/MazF family toxin [Clostridia bacterium]|nr:type II toxin-antitoxin system PemK/MazF family toxin [Clostridia bacterium]
MTGFSQGDIIKISGFKRRLFVIVSKNAFIRATGIFHVCPFIPGIPEGPIHITAAGRNGAQGTVICEQMKAIDPNARSCSKTDILEYSDIMNISDVIQGIFEYD